MTVLQMQQKQVEDLQQQVSDMVEERRGLELDLQTKQFSLEAAQQQVHVVTEESRQELEAVRQAMSASNEVSVALSSMTLSSLCGCQECCHLQSSCLPIHFLRALLLQWKLLFPAKAMTSCSTHSLDKFCKFSRVKQAVVWW